jgi:hypothetical protein
MPLEAWDSWSRPDPRYKPGECARKWRSFQDRVGGATAGTVYYYAKQSGWQYPVGGEVSSADDAREDFQRQKKAAELFESWRAKTSEDLCAAIFLANNALNNKGPDEWTQAEVLAIKNRDRLEYWESRVNGDALEDRISVFRIRGEVKTLCQAIMLTSQMKS